MALRSGGFSTALSPLGTVGEWPPLACQFCDREVSSGDNSPWGPGAQRDSGGGSAGASGKMADRFIAASLSTLSSETQERGEGMRWE